MTAELIAEMSVAPEIAVLAGSSLLVPAEPAPAAAPAARPTLGTLARHLRILAASPERWWGLVRFDPARTAISGATDISAINSAVIGSSFAGSPAPAPGGGRRRRQRSAEGRCQQQHEGQSTRASTTAVPGWAP